MSKMKNLQLQIPEDVIEFLRNEKRNQGVTMSKLVEKLIVEIYSTPLYKFKKIMNEK